MGAASDESSSSVFLSSPKGIIQIAGTMNLSASGAKSSATLDVAGGASKLQFDGVWTVTSSGYQSKADVLLNQTTATGGDVIFAKISR